MKRLVFVVAIVLVVYLRSYALYRSANLKHRADDGRGYVSYENKPALYYFYRPVSYVDARLTRVRSRLHVHEELHRAK